MRRAIWGAALAALTTVAFAQDGAALYRRYCAQCHDSGAARIPPRSALEQMTRAQIVATLESGPMQAQGVQRTPAERQALAAYLTHRSGEAPGLAVPATPCPATNVRPGPSGQWSSWGADLRNRRFQQTGAGLTAADVPRLELRWAFGFPDATSASSQPTVMDGSVYVSSTSGRIYALDLQRGCTYWTFDAGQTVRSAVVVVPAAEAGGRPVAFFTDRSANVYSVDARTGALRWKRRVGGAMVSSTGSPVFYAGRLYVPLTGNEEGAGGSPTYECCRSHGMLIALDAATGQVIWEASTLSTTPHPTRRNAVGTQLYGPSGAGVWSAPTIDTETHRLYVATGDSYSDPAGDTSDAILAFDLANGRMLWSHQATARDAYNSGCDVKDHTGCPLENGPDFDFGQPPMLVSLPRGKRLLVVGQKSGVVYALDPDHSGKEVWHARVGTGGVLGGLNWGSATDGRNAYVDVSDHLDIIERDSKLNPHAGGVVALRLTDGKQLWRINISGCAEHEGSLQRLKPPGAAGPPDFGCSAAQSAPVTVIPGVVFAGSEDGHLRGYFTRTGRVLFDFDTAREFDTVNYVAAHGGSIDMGGPAVADGVLLTTSGYSKWGGMPGNVLLAFSVAAEQRP